MLYKILAKLIKMPFNKFHPLVYIGGEPEFGKNVFIGLLSVVNAKGAHVTIGDNCDIASFVSINVADSHKRVLEQMTEIERRDIILEKNVFVGSHSFIGGGVHIGHHSVIGAGTIIAKPCKIPPFSLAIGNPVVIKEGHFLPENKKGNI